MMTMAQRVLKIIGILLAFACLLVVRLAAQPEASEQDAKKILVKQP
ncbi:MAG: hypothetical protein FD123_4397 [Bacteroidetes bacterium]|nr:MAG: hypothetical protein FD123_4397 [Bacteroidota bacterium]